MKRIIGSAILFFFVFAAVYLILCFAIPGLRIKLEAGPVEYALKCIRHMAWAKAAVSFVIALLAAAIPLVLQAKRDL